MFSIITITYNNLSGLKKTAQSVLSQTYKDYEWIIIDGASKDETPNFLETLNTIKVSEPDQGIYDAMNKGLERGQQDYVIFMNAGDVFASEDILEKLSAIIEQQDSPDFIYGPALEERKDKEPVLKPANDIKNLFWGMVTHHQAMLYKISLCENLRYDTSYQIAADYDFTCRFIEKAETTFKTDFPICLFESGGVSQISVKQGRNEQYMIRDKLEIVSPFTNALIYFGQKSIMSLRQRCPDLYWALRKGKKS